MPRVKASVARKDYPKDGIKKGETYYSWAHFRQPVQRSKTYPKRSQLDSTKMSAAYAAAEALEDALDAATTVEDISAAVDECVSSIESVISEYEDSLSSLEEAFPGGSPVIDDHEEKKSNLEQFLSDLEEASAELGQLDPTDYIDQELEVDGKVGDKRNVRSFDDLSPDEQHEMLEAAQELLASVNLE